MTPSLPFDRSEIVRALNVYHQPGDVVELRIPKAGRAKTISGYFEDVRLLADSVVGLSDDRDVKEAGGVYITLNQIDGRLISRAKNRYKKYAETTTADGDVVRLNWLPVDCDPIRPAGIPSSDEEHNAALDKAREVKTWLIGRGWPADAFVVGDSGNGGHLPVKIDLETSTENVELVKRCLAALDFIFSDEAVKVDLTTFNPARIWKLPGTVTRKGDTSEERPHRMARLLEAPEILEVAPRELLEDLGAILPEDDPVRCGQRSGDDFDPVGYAEDHDLKVSKVKPWNGGVLAELEVCPFNSDHRRTARIGRLPSGARYFGCFHDGCKGNDWHSLRDLLEPERERRESTAPRVERSEKTNEEGEGFSLNDFCYETEDKDGNPKFVFSPTTATRSIIRKSYLRMTDTEADIYRFNGQIYQPDGGRKIDLQLCRVAGDRVSGRDVKEVTRRVKNELLEDPVVFDGNPYLLGVKNGVVDLQSGEFRDYRPDDLITYQLDVTYDPAARCPRFVKFLEEIQPNVTDRLTLVDWFPATAIRRPLPYVLFLLGLGRNGKGVYERLIKRFFGAAAFRDMALAEVSKNNFAAGTFYKKLGWIATEQSGKKKATIGTDFIKLVTGAGSIDADRKNLSRIQFEPYFQTTVDTNAMPMIEDTSIGWMERFCKQDLPFVFVDDPDPDNPLEKKKDPRLLDKLTTDEELSGILNLLIWRAKEISETETIIKRSAGELFNEYTKQSASVSTFCDLFLEYEEGLTEPNVPTIDIYEAYKRWCSYLVGEVVDEAYLGRYLRRFCNDRAPSRPRREGKRCTAYPGLLFHDDKVEIAISALSKGWTGEARNGQAMDKNNFSKTDMQYTSGTSGQVELWNYIIWCFGTTGDDLPKGENCKNARPTCPLVQPIPSDDILKKSTCPLPAHSCPLPVQGNDATKTERESVEPTGGGSVRVSSDPSETEDYQTIAEGLVEAAKREVEYLGHFRTPELARRRTYLALQAVPTFTDGTRSWTLAKGDLVSGLPGFLAHPLIDRGMLRELVG